MSVLFFSSGKIKAENRLRVILETLGQDIEVYRTSKTLSMRLCRPRGDVIVMIFMVPDRKTLLNLLLIRQQMYDLPVILILPDAKRDTLSKAHQFYPRFITEFDSDSHILAQVLHRIILRETRKMNFSAGVVSMGMG